MRAFGRPSVAACGSVKRPATTAWLGPPLFAAVPRPATAWGSARGTYVPGSPRRISHFAWAAYNGPMTPSTALISQLAEELRGQIAGEVRFDDMTRGLYSTDASIYQISLVG